MSDRGSWSVTTDGTFYAGQQLSGLEYNHKLNLLLVTSQESGLLVYDSTSTLLKKSDVSGQW